MSDTIERLLSEIKIKILKGEYRKEQIPALEESLRLLLDNPARVSLKTKEISSENLQDFFETFPERYVAILGYSKQLSELDICKIAGEFGFPKDNLKFLLDYQAFKKIDVAPMVSSDDCCGVILGQIPHKILGGNDTLGIIHSHRFFTKAESEGGKFKINKSSLERAFRKLREEIILQS